MPYSPVFCICVGTCAGRYMRVHPWAYNLELVPHFLNSPPSPPHQRGRGRHLRLREERVQPRLRVLPGTEGYTRTRKAAISYPKRVEPRLRLLAPPPPHSPPCARRSVQPAPRRRLAVHRGRRRRPSVSLAFQHFALIKQASSPDSYKEEREERNKAQR